MKRHKENIDDTYEKDQRSLSDSVKACIDNGYGLETTIKEVLKFGNYDKEDIKSYYDTYKKYLV